MAAGLSAAVATIRKPPCRHLLHACQLYSDPPTSVRPTTLSPAGTAYVLHKVTKLEAVPKDKAGLVTSSAWKQAFVAKSTKETINGECLGGHW